MKHDAVDKIASTALPPHAVGVSLDNACGRVLLEPVKADRDHPPFDRATMDGYAVHAAECTNGTTLPVVGDLPAGTTPPGDVPAGTCITIATGAAVPMSCDAVVEHEQTDRANPVRFNLDRVEPRRNIHPRGVDCAEGDVLLKPPLRLSPADIGVAAIAGKMSLTVARAPTVAIVTSGDELVDVAHTPGPYQLRDSNGPMLAAALRSFGADVTTICRAPDDLEATIEVLKSIDVDLLLSVGGVSQGTHDHIKPAWDAIGATLLVDRVPIQPGKPTRCWKTPTGMAIALPGNPVAAIICAHLFARPWIRASLGLQPLGDWSSIALAHDVMPNPTRTLYRAAHVNTDARLATWHGSGDLPHLAGTDGIVECAMQRDVIPAGTVCPFLRWTLD